MSGLVFPHGYDPALHKERWYLLATFFLIAIVIYYLGEMAHIPDFRVLRLPVFYSEHDIQRLLFLIPIIYASHYFRITGVIISSFISSVALIPRALFISPFPDSVIRTVIFIVTAAAIGLIYALLLEQRQKDKRLEIMAAERDRFKRMLESVDVGIIIIGPDYKIRFCNNRMKKDFGDGFGRYCYNYLPEQTHPCDQKPCRFLRALGADTHKWEYTFKDGRVFETIASPFIDFDGNNCQLTALKEVTQQKKNEMELLGINKLSSDIVVNLSHELKNPLNCLKGTLTGLLRPGIEFDPKTQDRFFLDMLEETERLDNMVTDLLDISKIEAGISKPNRTNFNVSDVIMDALAKEKRIHPEHLFCAEIEPNLPKLPAVYGQIMQVLTNLLDNATSCSDKGTTVKVTAFKSENMLKVQVEDQGVGISPSDVKKIFQRYYRGNNKIDKSGTQDKGHIGLGLAICQSIIHNHKGKIWVNSSVGKGSIFNFTLPFVIGDER